MRISVACAIIALRSVLATSGINVSQLGSAENHFIKALQKEDEWMATHLRDEGYTVIKSS